MAAMSPDGDPARFRQDLQGGVDNQIGAATAGAERAQGTFDEALQALFPGLGTATMRGSNIRAGLQTAKDAVMERVRQLYEPINNADAPVDVAPLRDQFGQIDQNLPLNDRARFRPSEANVPGNLVPPEPEGPTATGVLDAYGRPIMREPDPVDTTVPLREVTAMRSGLTDDIRGQRASGQNQAARVGTQYRDAIDQFTENAIPPELRGQLDTARAARRDRSQPF